MSNEKIARELIEVARELMAAWPSKVKQGGLRKAMGLSADKPLEEQTSPQGVAAFFKKADEKGRGMVMFAVNSNKTSAFWKKVSDAIGSKKAKRNNFKLDSLARNVDDASKDLLEALHRDDPSSPSVDKLLKLTLRLQKNLDSFVDKVEFVKSRASSETARQSLYTSKGSMKHIENDVMSIRDELRAMGYEREADAFFMKAHDALSDLRKLFTKAEKAR